MRDHERKHASTEHIVCDKCNEIFDAQSDLTEHLESHDENTLFECNMCEQTFQGKEKLEDHTRLHKKQTEKEKHKCSKCDKIYYDMRKLRRHDWRSHRTIECTICSEVLASRQDISSHRQNSHRMFRKIFCKYFPDCYDDDECLYYHNVDDESPSVCPQGQECTDQSCTFSEQNHQTRKQVLCRFQEKCNRSGASIHILLLISLF